MIRTRRGWRPFAAAVGCGLAIVSPSARSHAVPTVATTATTAAEIADDFERDALGSNWTVAFGSVGIWNRSDLALSAASPIGIASWVGSTPGPDQRSGATISKDKPANMLIQVFVRRRPGDAARYGLHYNDDRPEGSRWEIKYDGVPTAQTRILASSSAPGPAADDVIHLEARGSGPVELRGFRNGALILTASDSSANAIANGPPGVAFRLRVGTTTSYPAPVVERWTGGPLPPTSPPGTSPPQTSPPGASPPGTSPSGSGATPGSTSPQPEVGSSAPAGPEAGQEPPIGTETSGREAEDALPQGASGTGDRRTPFVPAVILTLAVGVIVTTLAIARRKRARPRP